MGPGPGCGTRPLKKRKEIKNHIFCVKKSQEFNKSLKRTTTSELLCPKKWGPLAVPRSLHAKNLIVFEFEVRHLTFTRKHPLRLTISSSQTWQTQKARWVFVTLDSYTRAFSKSLFVPSTQQGDSLLVRRIGTFLRLNLSLSLPAELGTCGNDAAAGLAIATLTMASKRARATILMMLMTREQATLAGP